MAALVALERAAFDEAGQYLRQARREVRGIDAPLVAWRIEAVTATLLEKTAQPDSAPPRPAEIRARAEAPAPAGPVRNLGAGLDPRQTH